LVTTTAAAATTTFLVVARAIFMRRNPGAAKDGSVKVLIVARVIFERRKPKKACFCAATRLLEWLLPLLVQVLVAGPLHHPPLLTSQNNEPTTKSWVDQ